ncbi:MAG TPA: S8 family serine peptidase, partial [Thermoanaerobaculia bacterium]|nr:S8 family serine peptidase [Thermoanaerobaculia bacterium]
MSTWIALLALVVVAAAGAAELRPAKYAIPDQYIVVLKDDVARSSREAGWAPTVSAVAQDMAVIYGAKVEHVYEHALSGFVGRLEKQDLERLLNDPRVAYVEEDGLVWASATQSNATWGLDRIDQRNLPLSGTYTYDTTATNVRVYVIDTGIRAAHSDFGGRVLAGYTAISDGRGTEDCNGHGTHVAGTVGGATWGVAKGVRLVPVRVLDCQGSGTNSGVIAGVDWVTANRVKPAVANM